MSDLVMLAHEYKEDKHKSKVDGWWISEKYDGVCGLFKQADQKMYSRNGNVYSLPDFFVQELISVGIDLHGEIWFGYDTFDLCSGMARRDDTNDKAWESVTFMVFDTPNKDLPFEDRIKLIQKSLNEAGKPKHIKGVKFYKYHADKMTIEEELRKAEERGAEGLVLRKPRSKYEIKRSHDMLKVKSWTFKEARVIGYNEGTGKYKGMVGALQIQNEEFGKFKVGSGLNDWQRGDGLKNPLDDQERKTRKEDFSKDEKYLALVEKTKIPGKVRRDALRDLNLYYASMPVIGDIITFRYKEITKDGNPKFPSFVGVRDYE